MGLLLLVLLAVAAVWVMIDEGAPELSAAPYTVRPVAHPFDPDWPDVELMFRRKCSACHRPGGKQSDLTSYEAVMAAKSEMYGGPIVVPGNPDESPLWRVVNWNAEAEVGSPAPDAPLMPDDHREWLTAGQLDTLRRWIARGALQYKLPEQCSPRPLLETDFPSAKECGVCHPKQYDEWSHSMHHYAQHSPIFEAFNLTLLERTSGTIGTFCSRCHTPLGTALGEDGHRRNVHRSRLSMEGVSCVVCHRLPRGYYKSNARVATPPGTLLDTCVYGPFDDPVSEEVQAHPAAKGHYIETPAFCGSCHDVTSPQGVRLEEAFSEWQNSPAAREGITCQHCHMGPVQGRPIPKDQRPLGRAAVVPGVDPERIPLRHLSDHTFSGPDYSLLPDTEFPHKLDWMYEKDYRDTKSLTPHQRKTLEELRRSNRRHLKLADQKRYELLVGAASLRVRAPSVAAAGRKLKIRVDVKNHVAGHNFPTGFTAERQLWVAVTLHDPLGRPVFQSGDLDKNGDLRDAHSHAVEAGELPYDRHLLNFQNQFVALTARGTERTVVLSVNRHLQPLNIIRPATGISASFGRPETFRIAKGSLPPLGTAGQTYPVRLPEMTGDYHLSVRLNFRHLPPVLLDAIGTPHLKHLLEIVEIDRFDTAIRVLPATSPLTLDLNPWERLRAGLRPAASDPSTE